MTENEKLRALLAEARRWVVGVQDDALDKRIDAALAEPVVDESARVPWACHDCGSMGDFSSVQYAAGDFDVACDACGSKDTGEASAVLGGFISDLEETRRERDEARAEAARWREEGEGLLRYACEASAAYKRGAEAMREAAAKEVFAFYGWSKDNETTRTDIKNLAELIDALPAPEDKS